MASQASAPSELYRGYDPVSRGMVEAAVTGTPTCSSGSGKVQIRVCETLSELADALEVHTSLSASYLAIASMSAKAEFMQSLKVTSRSVSIVVYASHIVGIWKAGTVRLIQGITAPANAAAAAKFARPHGDSYVSSATTGGEYIGVYTFQTETRTEQESLTAELKAKGLASGVTASAEVQTKMTHFLSTTTTSYTFEDEITGIANPTMPKPEEMIEFARTFPSKPINAPVTIRYEITGYEDASCFDAIALDAVIASREYFLGFEGSEGLMHKLNRLLATQNQVEWIKGIYETYGYTGDAPLAEFATELENDIATARGQISARRRNPTATFALPALNSLGKGLPVLQIQKKTGVQAGGRGGNPWNFRFSVDEAIRNRVKMKSIQIGADDVVERIDITYDSSAGKWTESVGKGSAAQLSTALTFGDGEFIKEVKARAGDYVDWLRLATADGRWIVSEGKSSGGGHVEWICPDGNIVVGLEGRADKYINRVSVIEAKLVNAKFLPR